MHKPDVNLNKCPYNKLKKSLSYESIKVSIIKLIDKILIKNKKTDSNFIEALNKISFQISEELKKVDFIEYLDKQRLHHDKDANFFGDYFNEILVDIFQSNKVILNQVDRNSLDNNIKSDSNSQERVILSFYEAALLDIFAMISLVNNGILNKNEGIKLLLNNMKSGKKDELIHQEIFKGLINNLSFIEIQENIVRISSELGPTCPFIKSKLSKKWLLEVWSTLENNLFSHFKQYHNRINNDDVLGKFCFGINKKTED